MSARWFSLCVILTIVSLAPAAFWNDDSHYVSLGSQHGYYIVRPDSQLFRQLGLYEAPVIDTADPLGYCYGAESLSFEVYPNGVLTASPPYIASAMPNEFYTRTIAFSPP